MDYRTDWNATEAKQHEDVKLAAHVESLKQAWRARWDAEDNASRKRIELNRIFGTQYVQDIIDDELEKWEQENA